MTISARPARAAAFLRAEAVSIVALALLLATLGFVLVTAIHSPLKDDVAWLLYVARKWLAGKRLYVDLVEVNPPLIVWIYALPAAVAGWLGTAPKLVADPFFAACVLGSAWWTATLLQGQGGLFARRVPVFAAIGIVLLVLPGIEFGQREHLLVAAVLPYLVLFARALDGEPEPPGRAPTGEIAAGIVAGLGCALKPTYALAFVLLELIFLLRRGRRLRIAALSAAAAMALYGLGVLLFCPAFMAKAVPLALALYGGTDTPCLQIIAQSRTLLFGEAVALLLCWHGGGRGPGSAFQRHLLLALTVFAIGASAAFLIEGKNWFYHRLPATVATVLALLLWAASLLRRRPRQSRPALLAWLAAPLALAALLIFGLADYHRLKPWAEAAETADRSPVVKIERLIRKEHAHTYIAFSEWIGLGFPVVNNTGVAWASRFDSMWALHGELWRIHRDGVAPRAWPIRHWIIRDFIAGCPDLAVVDARRGLIDYIAVLSAANAGFARAWTHYHRIAAFDGLEVFKRDTAGCAGPPPHGGHRRIS